MGLTEDLLAIKNARNQLIQDQMKARATYDATWDRLKELGINTPEELDAELEKLNSSISIKSKEFELAVAQSKAVLGLA